VGQWAIDQPDRSTSISCRSHRAVNTQLTEFQTTSKVAGDGKNPYGDDCLLDDVSRQEVPLDPHLPNFLCAAWVNDANL